MLNHDVLSRRDATYINQATSADERIVVALGRRKSDTEAQMAPDPNNKPQRALSRRNALKTLAVGTTSLALAACGSPSSSTPSAPAASGSAAATTSAGAAASAGPSPEPTVAVANIGQGTNRIVFWHGLGGADGKTMQSMLTQYAGEQSNTTVQSETYDWNVFYQKFPTAIAAQRPPDMALMHEWAIRQFAAQGLLQPVDDLFFNAGIVPRNDFNPALMETISVDGKVMGIPLDTHGWGLFYNTKLIQDAGLDPNTLPKNGDEFVQWALKITTDENGKHPDEDGFDANKVKVWAIHNSWQRFTMPSTLWQFGGGVLDDAATKSILDTEQSIAAVQYWVDLMYEHRVCAAADLGAATSNDLYKTNSLAMMWNGSWNLNFFKDNPELEQVTRAAFLNSLAPDGRQATKFGSSMLVIPEGVKEDGIERARNLIAWLSDNGKLWAASGQVPARLSVQTTPEVQDNWSVKVFAEQFSKIGKTEVPHAAITEIVNAYETAISAALSNTTPTKEALMQGSKSVQAILERG